MNNPEVFKLKLGHPPEGLRSIAWFDGIKEKHMLLRAASDWDASIAIDNSGDEKETFCVAVSPDGAGLKVIRMTEKGLPKTLDFSDAGVQKAVGGNVLEMETDDIVTAVRGGF